MPARAVQVFGPTTVDPGFTTTGEKTLLTMATTLPAGGKNVILCVMTSPNLSTSTARGTLRIYKGTTLLHESIVDNYLWGQAAKPRLLFAVDDTPAGNDVYYFKLNLTATATVTGSCHVQGMVVKADDAAWVKNTTGTAVANGATATIATLSTAYPAGSKVAIVASIYGYYNSTTGTQNVIGAGNYRLKSGATIVSSNQFSHGSYSNVEPAWIPLSYLETPTSSTQSYSIEVYNNSGYSYVFFGEIVAFTIYDGAFLDTASVALTANTQVTVGNLSTTLQGDVAVIALGAAENTTTTNVTAFNAGGVVLQINNDATTQISNQTSWFIYNTGTHARSGVLSMFRFDSNLYNPSYQVKMTAAASGLNGEAKILVFKLPYTRIMSETVSMTDATVRSSRVVRAEIMSVADVFFHDWLYIAGDVKIDDDIIGEYGIGYKDFAREGLPIQTLKHVVYDKVILDGEEIGSVGVEWDDKVADLSPGERFLYVISSVELVED